VADFDIADVEELDGWLSLPVAAQRLGVTRQRVYQMIQEGRIPSAAVRKIPGVGDRPAADVVREAEIDQIVAAELAHVTPQAAEATVPA